MFWELNLWYQWFALERAAHPGERHSHDELEQTVTQAIAWETGRQRQTLNPSKRQQLCPSWSETRPSHIPDFCCMPLDTALLVAHGIPVNRVHRHRLSAIVPLLSCSNGSQDGSVNTRENTISGQDYDIRSMYLCVLHELPKKSNKI